MNLSNKVSLVTGGNRGIGKFISLSLAEEGSSVAVHYNQDKEGAESVVKEIKEKGGNAEVFQADVSQRESVEKMVENCSKSLGQIDVLVNNAGIAGPTGPSWSYSLEDWRRVIDVDLNGDQIKEEISCNY